MKNNLAFILYLFLILMGRMISFAQEQWERDGEIEDVEIEIVRERQIVLPKANRNFEKVPPRPSEPIKPAIVYDFKNLNFSIPDYNPNIRPLRLKQEEIAKVNGNFVSAGFGNYASPYLNAWFNTKRDKSRHLGASIYHRSFGTGPIDEKNSASGNTQVRVFGKTFTNSVTSGGYLNYENASGYYYGYTPGLETVRDSIRQSYDRFSLGGEVSNTKSGDINYSIKGNFSYLTDDYEAAESDLELGLQSDYKINEETRINVVADYSLISRKDSLVEAKPRHLFKAASYLTFAPIDKLILKAGARIAIENDSIDSKSIHFYPVVNAEYYLSDRISAYATVGGDMDKVSLHTVSRENLWVNSNIGLFHTNKAFEFILGMKGKVGQQFFFDLGINTADLKNFYLYQNSISDRAKFDLLYDRVQRVNFFGEFGLNKNEVVRLSLRSDYFAYSTDVQPEAWHRPTYRFGINSAFNLYQKILLNVNLVGQGGIMALNNETASLVELDPALDLNAQATYRISKQASAFLKFENLLSNEYQVYLNYPVRGIMVLGGVSFSF